LARRGAGALIEGPDGEALNRNLEDIDATTATPAAISFLDDGDGLIVAIGALRRDGETIAEVKRMRVLRTGSVKDVAEKCSVRSSRGHPDLVLRRSSSTLRSSWLPHGRYTQAAFTLRLAALGSSGIDLSSCGRTCKAAAPAINVAFAVPFLPMQVDRPQPKPGQHSLRRGGVF
jgi:hypothetical protein